ncbi:DUF4390 domain-containing protein [Desulforhopalus vacuolatus]|uniref:DUF4390 domain-containing protein n=1 Tax=Desulforhopalus vacuolatus TaxID=40414 RepID=UPI00196517EB|nr:DUF4390 domain-containing protein [Desulforhopalus vacuolatus]MBM9519792.1 DUF4390 domain-containing protein [Desulforhopalus vacuolatus]
MLRTAAFLLLFTFFLPALSARADDTAEFIELTAAVSPGTLLFYAKLKHSLTAEMREELHSGLPLTFTFTMELHRNARGGPGELVAEKIFEHIISYDTLTDDYRVRLGEHNNRSKVFTDAVNAEKALNTLSGVPIINVGRLIPNNTYTLRIKAGLYHKSLPPGLESILPFLTWDDRRIDWQTIEFHYQSIKP